jgi:hypothetical protein
LPKPKPKTPSTAEQYARSRTLKGNAELASAFGITDSPPRELVRVDSLPDPPDAAIPGPPTPERESPLNVEEAVTNIFREEADEIGIRLARFGIAFHPGQKQELVDHGLALIAGLVGGGAIARRP